MSLEVLSFRSLRRIRPALINYRRGENAVRIVAIKGGLKVESHTPGNVVINVRSEDFVIVATDLAFGGSVAEPTPNDRIEHVRKGLPTLTYEVVRQADGACWRWLGHEHELVRIHTRLVS